jgi:two-component system, OmpR family, sensor histidine kinase KdpD
MSADSAVLRFGVMQTHPSSAAANQAKPLWPGLLAWIAAWSLMLALDGRVDLANQALLLILAAALAAIWWGPTLSAATIGCSVLAFNFAFVPPRGTFAVDLHQHGLLLLAMVSVSWIVTALMARLRRLAVEAEAAALRSDELRRWGDALRESEKPLEGQSLLRDMLARLGGGEAALWVLAGGQTFGTLSSDERDGLRLCVGTGHALGPGSGRHEDQSAWYLPLRGRQRTHGAALVRLDTDFVPTYTVRAHAQALCDQLGVALERAAAELAATQAHEQAQLQSMRNTLLSAVAHDHRTPLATIISAAGALHDQADRLGAQQRQRLATTILDEASQLARITDNTLQLARLDAVGLDLARDWESPEELIGSVIRRLRQRDPAQRLRARVPAGLPLVRCDAVLMVQLIDNLVDNALKHAGGDGPVEVTAQTREGRLVIGVRDRGPGVPAGLLPRLFEPFSRGPLQTSGAASDAPSPRGTGVGLALCRAIARVHGGELTVRQRRGGGACFEVSLPIEPLPAEPGLQEHREPPA